MGQSSSSISHSVYTQWTHVSHSPVSVLLGVGTLLLQLQQLFRRCILDLNLLLSRLLVVLLLVDNHLLVLLLLLQTAPTVLHVLVDYLDLRVHVQDVVNKVSVNVRHRPAAHCVL